MLGQLEARAAEQRPGMGARSARADDEQDRRVGWLGHAQQGTAGVAVHDTPLHVTAVQPGVGRDLARHVAVHLVMPGQAGVLQQPDRMHHP